MESRINNILSTINGFYLYDDYIAHKYISLIKEAIELIRGLESQPTSMLENAKNNAVTELSNELMNRMNDGFFKIPMERRKSEFKISRMLVAVAIGEVLTNISAAND